MYQWNMTSQKKSRLGKESLCGGVRSTISGMSLCRTYRLAISFTYFFLLLFIFILFYFSSTISRMSLCGTYCLTISPLQGYNGQYTPSGQCYHYTRSALGEPHPKKNRVYLGIADVFHASPFPRSRST